jgi:hypothetical protein
MGDEMRPQSFLAMAVLVTMVAMGVFVALGYVPH